jgi:hypothetical protein
VKREVSSIIILFLLICNTSSFLVIPTANPAAGAANIENKASLQPTVSQTFEKAFGGAQEDWGYSVVQTIDGGYALAGYTSSFGAGNGDAWLIKTDAAGNQLWNKTYGGTDWDYAYSMVRTIDGGFALAGLTSNGGNVDFWLVKTDSSGNQLWSKTYGGTGDDRAYSVVQTSDGGYALAGSTTSYSKTGVNVGNDFLLIKTDSAGNQVWSKNYDWTTIATRDEIAYSVVQTNDGGYALLGSADTAYYGYSYDFWLVKTDSTGNQIWNKTYGGTGYEVPSTLIKTSDGGYGLAGIKIDSGISGFWLVKTDSTGNQIWNKNYGGTGVADAQSVVQTSDGGYAIAGYTDTLANQDFLLVKTNSYGNQQWSRTFGGTASDSCYSAVQTSDGEYALLGYTESYGAGNKDFWFVKVPAESPSPSVTPTPTPSVTPTPTPSVTPTPTPSVTPTQYSLSVSVVGTGCSVSKSPNQATYNSGSVVTLTPSAASGWTFTSWSGDLSGSANPAQISVTRNKVVTATFTQILPTQTQVGVNIGDWVEYSSKYYNPTGTLEESWREKFEIIDISSSTVTSRTTFYYNDGTQESEITKHDGSEGFSGIFIFGGRKVGDSLQIMRGETVVIESQQTRTYAGQSRTVLYGSFDSIAGYITCFWDKQSGISLEMTATTSEGKIVSTAVDFHLTSQGFQTVTPSPTTSSPKFTIASPPSFNPEQPIANQPFTITVSIVNTGTSSIPSPQLIYVTNAWYPTRDAAGQQPTLFCTALSSNPKTISPSQQVTLKYTGIAKWNFISPQTLEGFLSDSFKKLGEQAATRIIAQGVVAYAKSELPTQQAALFEIQFKLSKAYLDTTTSGYAAIGNAIEFIKSNDYTPGAVFELGFDSGGYQVQGSLGSVNVISPSYKLVELQQWAMAKITASVISSGAGVVGTALLTVPVPGPHWLITGTLYGISAAVGPATNAYYRRLLVDPVDNYMQNVTLSSPPSTITSLPNSTYRMLAYYTYEYVAYLEASIESSARAYGALEANSTYYATVQFENAKVFAQKASAKYPMLISYLNQTLNDLSPDVNETSFNQGLSLLKEQGLPENVTQILQATGLLGYFNLTTITTLTYQPVNSSLIVESMPNLGSFLESDAQLKLANVAAMENQLPSSTQSPSPMPISGVSLPMEVLYVTATVVILIAIAAVAIVIRKRKAISSHPPPPPP